VEAQFFSAAYFVAAFVGGAFDGDTEAHQGDCAGDARRADRVVLEGFGRGLYAWLLGAGVLVDSWSCVMG